MKKISFILGVFLTVLLLGCGTNKGIKTVRTVEDDKRRVEKTKLSGVEEAETLSPDGSKMVKKPFKWFLGTGTADDKQMAIEIAQREAYATISRIISNIVKDKAERGALVNNGKVQKAVKSHWEQVSESILKGCEPFGDAVIQYSTTKKMYTVYAKVAIEGSRYKQLLNGAADVKPGGLSGEELDKFIEVNESIIKAAE